MLLEELKALWRQDWAAMKAGTYVAPLPHPNRMKHRTLQECPPELRAKILTGRAQKANATKRERKEANACPVSA